MTRWMTGLVIAITAAAPAAAQETVAVRAGRIVPVVGEPIDGGVLLIRDGRIVAVGKDVQVPWDAKVIDAAGLTLAPGAIDPCSQRGLDRANERIPVVPFVSVVDGYDPVQRGVEEALRQGITTLGLTPGSDTLFGGRCTVVRTHGRTIEDAIRARDWALLLSMGPRSGTNRPGHSAEMRRAIADARDRRRLDGEAGEDAKLAGKPEPEKKPDPRTDLILAWLDGKLPALCWCRAAADLHRAAALLDAEKAKATLVCGSDAWKAAAFLADRKALVVLDPTLVIWERDPEDPTIETRHVTPAELHAAGVRFACTTTTGGLSRSPWYQAAVCIRHGVPRDVALKAVTLHGAEALGLADRLGSLEVGKEADVVAFTADPLSSATWVEWVMIQGQIVYRRADDPVVKRLMGDEKK